MLRLFFPVRPAARVRQSAPNRFRLAVEELGGRLAPSDLGGNDEPNNPIPPYVAPAAALQIEDYGAEESGHGTFVVSGRVVGAGAGTTVTFEAASSALHGRVVAVDADGYFSVTIYVPMSEAGGATVTAHDGTASSAPKTVDIEPTPLPGGSQ